MNRVLVLALITLASSLAGCHEPLDVSTQSSESPRRTVAQRVVRAGTDLPDAFWGGFRGGRQQGRVQSFPESWAVFRQEYLKVHVPGQGNSSPVVVGKLVFLTSVQQRQLVVCAIELNSGEIAWQRALGQVSGQTHWKNGYASATPAADEQGLYVMAGNLGFFCLDFAGNTRWHTPLGGLEHQWGSASSPVLVGDHVIQLCDGQNNSSIVAMHKWQGHQVWRIERQSGGNWSTPAVAEIAGETQILVNGSGPRNNASGNLTAYSPRDGRRLWSWSGTSDIPCPTMILGGGYCVSSSGRNGPVAAFRLPVDSTSPDPVWMRRRGGPFVPTGVVYQDRLYLVSDAGMLSCQRLDNGDELWRAPLRGRVTASLLAGDGQIVACCENGTIHVLAAADEFRCIAKVKLNDPIFATPAVVDRQLIIRTRQYLYRLGQPPSELVKIAGETRSADSPDSGSADGGALTVEAGESGVSEAEGIAALDGSETSSATVRATSPAVSAEPETANLNVVRQASFTSSTKPASPSGDPQVDQRRLSPPSPANGRGVDVDGYDDVEQAKSTVD